MKDYFFESVEFDPSKAEYVREEVFLSRVKMTTSCWEWEGSRDKKGYGHLYFQGKNYLAHRFSYALHKGKFHKGFFVLHKCDNPPCVNPQHLYLGKQEDNMRDASNRGRIRGAAGGIYSDRLKRLEHFGNTFGKLVEQRKRDA